MSLTNDNDEDLATELAELLLLLPAVNDPDEREWWEKYSAAEHRHRRPGHPPRPDGANYMVKKLTADMADPPRYPATFAAHCLRFFDDPSPEMVALVGHQLDLPGSGARVLEAICDLAWKIYLPSKISERQSDQIG